MSAIQIPLVGSPFSTAAPMVNRGLDRLDARTNYSNGGLAKGVMGTAGDSMSGYAGGEQSAVNGDSIFYGSPLQLLRAYRYCADYILDTRPYYDVEALDAARLPEGQRGHGFAKGGTSVEHFVNVQIPYILEYPPEFLFLSIFQNGGYFLQDGKERYERDIALAKGNIPRLLDAGITVIQAGMYPHNVVGSGSRGAQYKQRGEHEMRNWAARQRGLHYVPWLDRIKAFNPAQENDGRIDWLAGADVGDGLHSGTYGGWLQSERLEPVFRRLFPEYQAPSCDLSNYDAAVNPYANVLGAAGAMAGTGGLLNGVANSNIPAGVEVTYPTGQGVTLVPSIMTRNGRPVLRLAQDGTVTPSADGQIRVAIPFTSSFPGMMMETYAEGGWDNAVGWGGLSAGAGFPIRNSVGSIGAGCILPFPLTRRWKMLTSRPRGIEKLNNGRVEIAIDSMFVGGVPFSGALEIERVFFGRSDNGA